jgi:proline-specific peptidase
MPGYTTVEGEVDYNVPDAGKPCKTWYMVTGDIKSSSELPLILLHGGPGGGHEYLSSLTDLTEQFGIPLVFYDQIGCGRSTHLREKNGDTAFWSFDIFVNELDNLVDHLGLRDKGFHILGQSWGGQLGAVYASRNPRGLKKVIISSTPATTPLFLEGVKRMQAQMPQDIQDILERGESDPEYERAAGLFYSQHVCRLDPMPEPVQKAFANLADDPTTYNTIQGPSELVISGSLEDWDATELAKNITADTLLLNGRYDEMSELCMAPWFQLIPRVKWRVFENSSHMAHWEEREHHMQVVGSFLTKY